MSHVETDSITRPGDLTVMAVQSGTGFRPYGAKNGKEKFLLYEARPVPRKWWRGRSGRPSCSAGCCGEGEGAGEGFLKTRLKRRSGRPMSHFSRFARIFPFPPR
jgi:hypothetical protein